MITVQINHVGTATAAPTATTAPTATAAKTAKTATGESEMEHTTDYANSKTLRMMFGKMLPDMITNRAKVSEAENNINIDRMLHVNANTDSVWGKMRNMMNPQFDIIENKICTCKSCGEVSSIHINSLLIVEIDVKNEHNDMTTKRLAHAGREYIECYCCATGHSCIENVKDMIQMFAGGELTQQLETLVTNRKGGLDKSRIPKDRLGDTFRKFKPKREEISKQLKQWIVDVMRGINKDLVFSGLPETGKTFMSVASVQKLSTQGHTVRYIDHSEFCEKVFNHDYVEYRRECEECGVLIIDSLGSGSDSKESIIALMDLFRARKKPTIMTVDISATELIKKIERKNMDELFQNSNIIKF